MSPVPDDAWLGRVRPKLEARPDWRGHVKALGQALLLEVSDDAGKTRLLVPLEEDQHPRLLANEDAEPEDALRVTMPVATWERLLTGTADLVNAYMMGDLKVKANMMRLMKIATPAERLVSDIAAAHREAH